MESLRARWQNLVAGFWFVPGVTALAFAGLAFVLVRIDRASGADGFDVAYGGGAAAARDILAVLAGSLITVAGLTFSIMVVTLQLVSGQYTPRALRTFLGDRVTQLVGGAFVGVFAYSLIVLRTVRGGEDVDGAPFVPSLAVSVAIGLGLLALALLLVFVHHMGRSIQVSTIAARLAAGTLDAVDRVYPERLGEAVDTGADDVLRGWRAGGEPARVHAPRAGYLQAVALDDVATALRERRARGHVAIRPGDFTTERTTALELWPREALDDGLRDRLGRALVVADERDLRQDLAFGIRQLADIGIRALSPGVNDPTTAVTCVRYLQAVLERVAARALPAEVRRVQGEITLVALRTAFGELVALAFHELGESAAGQPRVAASVLDALFAVAEAAREHDRAGDRVREVVDVAERVGAALLDGARVGGDRDDLVALLGRLRALAAGVTPVAMPA